ncbi:MAG: NAD(P)-dependent oxidoreductase [bacterium]
MHAFITGATGVIGRRVVPLLLDAGHQVTAIVRDPERRAALARTGATAMPLDLFDAEAVRRAVDGHNVVINLATHMPATAVRLMLPGAFRENDRLRRDGAANLASAALAGGVERFIQESFAPIYEDGGDRWLDERAPVRAASYNRTIADAERSAARVTAPGREGIVLRFAGFYGPDGRFFKEAVKMLHKGMAPLPGRLEAFASSISHDDAAMAVVAALELPAGTYNVCDNEPVRRSDYFAAMADAFGTATPKPMPSWLAWVLGSKRELLSRSQRMSNAKLRSFGWAPHYVSVRSGFLAAAHSLSTP